MLSAEYGQTSSVVMPTSSSLFRLKDGDENLLRTNVLYIRCLGYEETEIILREQERAMVCLLPLSEEDKTNDKKEHSENKP